MSNFPGKKLYEGERYNVISVTRGWVGVKFPEKKCYVIIEWSLCVEIHFNVNPPNKCVTPQKSLNISGNIWTVASKQALKRMFNV